MFKPLAAGLMPTEMGCASQVLVTAAHLVHATRLPEIADEVKRPII